MSLRAACFPIGQERKRSAQRGTSAMLILVIPYEDDFGFGGPGCAPSMKIAILALSISVPEPNSQTGRLTVANCCLPLRAFDFPSPCCVLRRPVMPSAARQRRPVWCDKAMFCFVMSCCRNGIAQSASHFMRFLSHSGKRSPRTAPQRKLEAMVA